MVNRWKRCVGCGMEMSRSEPQPCASCRDDDDPREVECGCRVNRPTSFLLALRTIVAVANQGPLYREIDEDLQEEGGANGWLRRMLQVARDLDEARELEPFPQEDT